ncbi:hypothetical protein ANO14919_021250 [Xylariales sp. No.14919]|nr:hypothetical protein ANO14919_021250 [Xylariales sp. No.14919]
MASSAKGEALKPPQITVSAKEVGSTTINRPTREGHLDGDFESHEDMIPSTPASAHTVNSFDVDLEAMKPAQSQENLRGASMSGNRLNEDTSTSVWPGKAHWREKALAAKRKNRSCKLLARFSKPTQIAIQVATVLLVVGVAVGVGVGLSKSLGAHYIGKQS